MKAAFLVSPNLPLEIREFILPEPKHEEIRVKIEFAALNHRDLWALKGQYRGESKNLILGSDGSGKIDKVGSGVKDFLKDQEVIINPSLHWGDDEKIQGADFQILGNPDPGTFSEYIVVPAKNVFSKPTHLSLEEAAALPLAGLTGYRALFTKGRLKKGQNILITGIGGGVAQMAFQMALAFEAQVYVSSGSAQKLEEAISLGAKGGYLYNEAKWIQKAKNDLPSGFDLILDSASGKGFSDLIEVCAAGGNIVFFGGTNGNIGPIIPAKVFWRQISILGTTMGSPIEFGSMLDFYVAHSLKPRIDQIFFLGQINQAFERMNLGEQTGKIILKIG